MPVAPLPAAGKPLEHETEKAPSYFAWTTSPRRASLESLSQGDELKRATKMHLDQLRVSAASLQQSLAGGRLDDLTYQRRLQCKANIEHLDRPSAITFVSEPLGPPLAALLSPPPRLSRRAVLPAMPVHPLPVHILHNESAPKDIRQVVLKPSTKIATIKSTKKVHFEAPIVGCSALQATLEAHLKQRLAREKTQLLQKTQARSRRKAAKATSGAIERLELVKTSTNSPKEVPTTTYAASVPTTVANADAAPTSREAVAPTVKSSTDPAAPKATCGHTSKVLATTPKPESVHRVPSHIVPYFHKRHRYTNPLLLHPRYPVVHPRHLYTTEYAAAYCKPKRRALLLK
ncbi:hypothetical protein, variant [Saprolegnia diclina VS20]|nr:hypothetical protein, variant [Saprolegnia diclina VS20]EQC42341.1 hypothetical protein, variant [Saprolegnia diclina VS20]|eukprot:XP_008603764.1 hypothetical protein, variant [Saprolegnia diclina VS20]